MIGIDIVNIKRVEKIYKKFNDSFLSRFFNSNEIAHIKKKNNSVETISGLYAAKEAVSKARGTGFSKLKFKDINILYKDGCPFAIVDNKLYYISISHEREYAVAVAVYNGNFSSECDDIDLRILNRRDACSHKGNYGKVAIIGGSKGMTGAAYLSSLSALRTGSGLVYNIVPENIVDIMSIKHVEVITKSFFDFGDMNLFLKNMNAVAVGPGMGRSEYAFKALKTCIDYNGKLVIDADGLNNLSMDLSLLKARGPFTTVLTPHSMEFSRISGYSLDYIEENRIKTAKSFAKKYECILLLKGANTVVTDGDRVYINRSGNPGMATAGSGDVLTGITVSLLGRGIDTYKSVCAAAYLHGLAGDKAKEVVGEEALIASDIVDNICNVISNIYIL